MPSYDFPHSFGDWEQWLPFAGALAGVLIVFIVIVLAVAVLFYVFMSLGLYTIAKRRGIANPGLAWVPVASMWVMGSLADQYDTVTTGKNMKLAQILLWLGVGCLAFSLIILPLAPLLAFVLWLATIATAVFEYMALYKIYQSASPENAVLLLVLSIIFSVIIPFVLFAIRNSDKGMPVIPKPEQGPQYGNPNQY